MLILILDLDSFIFLRTFSEKNVKREQALLGLNVSLRHILCRIMTNLFMSCEQ